jgi:hypothetical protein
VAAVARKAVLLVLLLVSASLARAETLALAPDHPERYVVQRGDTLWDISGRFLAQPWRWPEIWGVNPQVENPHLIYPGDVLRLVWTADGPRLVRDGTDGTVRLSPQVRETPITEPIPAVPLAKIRPFLESAVVLRSDELERFAYVVEGPNSRVVSGHGDRVYARRVEDAPDTQYDLFRLGPPYVDPDSGEHLGYAAVHIGTGALSRPGDPGVVFVKTSRREVLPRDILIPQTNEPLIPYFYPHVPRADLAGRIIAVVDGVTQIGQFDIVVLNRGARDGVELGHVLEVRQRRRLTADPVTREAVPVGGESAGHLMVFHVFDRLSYGLVVDAQAPMHLHDEARTP